MFDADGYLKSKAHLVLKLKDDDDDATCEQAGSLSACSRNLVLSTKGADAAHVSMGVVMPVASTSEQVDPAKTNPNLTDHEENVGAETPPVEPAQPKPDYLKYGLYYAKGAMSIGSVLATIFWIMYYPILLFRPYLLPEQAWPAVHTAIAAAPSTAIYSLALAAYCGVGFAIVLFICSMFELLASKRTPGSASKTIDLNMNKDAAFELCLGAASKCQLQHIDEKKGTLEIKLSETRLIDIRLEGTNESSCRIHVTAKRQNSLPLPFWKQEANDLLISFSGTHALSKFERYIKEHSELYTEHQHPAHEDRTYLDFKPSKRVTNRWIFLGVSLMAYPAMMLFFSGHSAEFLYKQARWERTTNPQAALMDLTHAMRHSRGPNPALLAERAEILIQLDQPRRAEADYLRALRTPVLNKKWLLYGLESALIQQGRLAEVAMLDARIARDYVETADMLNNRAWDEAISGDPEKAIEDSNTAVLRDPKFAPTYGTRGYARHLLGDDSAAVADYTTALSLNPTDRVDYFLRAQALRNLGEKELAFKDEAMASVLGFYWPELAVPPSFDEHGDPPAGGNAFTAPADVVQPGDSLIIPSLPEASSPQQPVISFPPVRVDSPYLQNAIE